MAEILLNDLLNEMVLPVVCRESDGGDVPLYPFPPRPRVGFSETESSKVKLVLVTRSEGQLTVVGLSCGKEGEVLILKGGSSVAECFRMDYSSVNPNTIIMLL